MTNRIIITKVIDTEHKVCELRNDVMNVALYLYETGRPDWYISEFANSKLDFLNAFIELKQPFNNNISSKILFIRAKAL